MHRLRWLAVPACLAVVSTIGPPAAATPSPPAATHDAVSAAQAPARAVTLITGDLVEVRGDGTITVRPGADRDGVGFLRQRHEGHDLVIPGDAVGLLAAGRVDRRLFDVTTLLAAGYDDARRDSIPLVVRYRDPATRTGARDWMRRHRAAVTAELAHVNAWGARTPKRDAVTWWSGLTAATRASADGRRPGLAGGIESVRLDGRLRVSLDQSAAQIGAPAAWQAGLTGRGVTVAVLDTGVDTSHPDLAGRVRENRNFSEAAEGGDVIGHGTHVASTIAGSGAASDGRYRGVAADADLLVGKVCEDMSCSESAMLAGMQWAAERGADVVNMSIGGEDTAEVDLLEEAVNRLSARHGTLFVVAAGNDGAVVSSVDSPSTAEAALSVAAGTRAEEVAELSSHGPRLGDGGTKPEITAPGVDIVAARSGQAPTDLIDPVGDRYARMSGTSMATPHVAGAAALLAQRHPSWTGAQLKAALIATAVALPGADTSAQGAGRVDLRPALAASVVPDTGSLNLGVREWPHHDDAPVTRTVTYRNDGSAPVTVAMAGTLTGPDGTTAPHGMLTVDPQRLTVPAGGSAGVTVTVDTSVSAPDGRYTGRITATPEAGTPVSTVLSVLRDVERYALTVRVLDRHGANAAEHTSLITSWADRSSVVEWTPGEHTYRLPAGDYTLGALVFTDAYQDTETVTLLARPKLTLTADTRVVLDARSGQPVTATVPEPTARFTHADIGYRVAARYPTRDTVLGWQNVRRGFDNLFTAQVGGPSAGDTFQSDISAGWARATADGDYLDSPYAYHLGWITPGALPTGLTHHLRTGDLAAVTSTFHGPAGRVGAAGSAAAGATGAVIAPELRLPGGRVDYYHGRDNARWQRMFVQLDTGNATEVNLTQPAVAYRAGRSYRETWNGAVLAPAFGDRPADSEQGARRTPAGQIVVDDGLLVDPTAGRGSLPKVRQDSGRTALYRDGQVLAESRRYGSLRADVPAEEARYRLEAAVDRSSYADVSTTVSSAWTFRSGPVDGTLPTALALLAVRYAPTLAEGRTAPAGRRFVIPVRVEHQPGSTGGTVTDLAVQVSYDDGATWQPATVTRSGGIGVAVVTHPADARHVSLRATAADGQGNQVEQTIIRAYLLG
ncbi:S8 family serine peptidase [Micromonospora sp. WMMD1120]|uniref:S8 family serine peptidase n=1 Tax=Micromonospora sp. WMMD1120 TaxID=3016106 RepID=UPI00241653DC|nr:S8 family serine peptidase [Micromonospora sp. WMMD1120]MDG4810098.1 S8 family serine peptidase [Micromonospora sp. WMMD1120]